MYCSLHYFSSVIKMYDNEDDYELHRSTTVECLKRSILLLSNEISLCERCAISHYDFTPPPSTPTVSELPADSISSLNERFVESRAMWKKSLSLLINTSSRHSRLGGQRPHKQTLLPARNCCDYVIDSECQQWSNHGAHEGGYRLHLPRQKNSLC